MSYAHMQYLMCVQKLTSNEVTEFVDISSGPAAQSRHHLRTVQTPAIKGHIFRKRERGTVTSDAAP